MEEPIESQLATGNIVTIEIDEIETETSPIPPMKYKYAGLCKDDPTFDDWMEKLAEIRRIANEVEDEI